MKTKFKSKQNLSRLRKVSNEGFGCTDMTTSSQVQVPKKSGKDFQRSPITTDGFR